MSMFAIWLRHPPDVFLVSLGEVVDLCTMKVLNEGKVRKFLFSNEGMFCVVLCEFGDGLADSSNNHDSVMFREGPER